MKKNLLSGDPQLKQINKSRWKSISNLLMLFMLLSGIGGAAKAQTVQIGSGSGTTSYIPFYYLYDKGYSQVIYTSAELIAAGMDPSQGYITKIRYLARESQSTSSWKDWTIYMENTVQESFSGVANYIPSNVANQVFDGQIANNVVNGEWLEITLDNPFQWDGTSNIVVSVNQTTPDWGGSVSWAGYTLAPTSGSKGIYFYRDGTSYDPLSPSGGTTSAVNLVPQIQFDGTLQAACAGTPTAGVLPATMGVCAGQTLLLQASGTTTGSSGLVGQWQTRASGSTDPWQNIVGGTSNPFTLAIVPVNPMEYQYTLACGANQDISNTMTTTINPISNCYCVPSATDPTLFINNFSTTSGIQNITNNNSGFSSNGYGNFITQTVSQVKGQSVSFTADISGGTAGFRIWVDWNHDGDFSPSEVVYSSTSYAASPTGSFSIPTNALSGSTRMRIASHYLSQTGDVLPCATAFTWGEFEDYTFNVIVPNAPSITQSSGTPDCVLGTDLTASGTLGANETWYWQTTVNGTDTLNDAANPWNVLENGTYYVRTYDSNYAVWSEADSIEIINVPTESQPTNLAAGQNPVCAPGTQITVDAAPSGVVNYWQGTSNISSALTDDAIAPYDVTATGTYYVKAFNTTTQCWSEPVGIAVTVGTIIPNDPFVDQSAYNFCEGITTAEITGETTYTGNETTLGAASGGGYSCNGNGGGVMFNITNIRNVDITITALDALLSATVNPTAKVYYKSGTYAGFEENEYAWTLLGDYATNGAASSLQYIDVDDFVIPAGETFGIYISYKASFSSVVSTQTWSDGNLTITSGNALCIPWGGINELFAFNGNVHYLEPTSTDINWYDAATGGNIVGTTSPLETVGTSVLPTVTAGSYDFYASSSFEGCESANRELVTVNIDPVNVTFTTVDATCNNGDDGSFSINTVVCGDAPFTYSVDGGTFGGATGGLTAGNHTVIVKDLNGAESAEYTITIGSAAAPSAITLDDFTNHELIVSWTANGSETSWNVEWGVPGFAPGTGAALGTAVATTNPYTITGLTGYTDYYVYVSANCGASTTAGDWNFVFATTDCDPMVAIGFCEDFEDYQNTTDCWREVDNDNDGDTWGVYSGGNAANSGVYAAGIQTDLSSGANDDYLIIPRMTLTGNEVLTYSYNGDGVSYPINYRVVLSTTGRAPADFTTVLFSDTVATSVYKDTAIDLSAYTGDVYIAFHIPTGSLAGRYLFIDDVCVDVCIPIAGTDGSVDVCRLDGTVSLNPLITSNYSDGNWSLPTNQNALNGSTVNLTGLPSGAYNAYYIKETFCTSDTTIAVINVFGVSTAGDGSTITVCKNEPLDLYSALIGNVDMGGDWYDYNGNLLPNSQPISSDIAAQYNYTYVASNGVCPSDTALVEVVVDPNCDYLVSVGEEALAEISVYPNPAITKLNIVNPSNTSSLKVEMLDMNGRVVLVENKALNNASEATIMIDHLERGIYTLRVYNNDGQRTFKVVKQ